MKKIIKIIVVGLMVFNLNIGIAFACEENLCSKIDLEPYMTSIGLIDRNPDLPNYQIGLHEAFNKEKLDKGRIEFGGQEFTDVLMVYREGDYHITSIHQIYTTIKSQNPDFEQSFDDYAKEYIRLSSLNMAMNYPNYEIVSINGYPWQHTKYQDSIIEQIQDVKMKQKIDVETDPLYLNIRDWRINGLGADMQSGKSLEEILIQGDRVQAGLPIDYEAHKAPTVTMEIEKPKVEEIKELTLWGKFVAFIKKLFGLK